MRPKTVNERETEEGWSAKPIPNYSLPTPPHHHPFTNRTFFNHLPCSTAIREHINLPTLLNLPHLLCDCAQGVHWRGLEVKMPVYSTNNQ